MFNAVKRSELRFLFVLYLLGCIRSARNNQRYAVKEVEWEQDHALQQQQQQNRTVRNNQQGDIQVEVGRERDHSFQQLPRFEYEPFSSSQCHFNSSEHNETSKLCKRVNCLTHTVDDMMTSSKGKFDNDTESPPCKMLWFSAIHDSDSGCAGSAKHSYKKHYSTALESALINAKDTLQPVLVLGRFGLDNENSTDHKRFGQWAEKKGVRVIYSPRLSFQHLLNKYPLVFQGVFSRLDIPNFLEEHNLLDIPGVCTDHVLYTDVDVVFVNKVTQNDIRLLTESVGNGMVSYGREYGKHPHICNTGVMVIRVKKFAKALPNILDTLAAEKFNHDQDLLNTIQSRSRANKKLFKLLPMQYNWKAYWGIEPTNFSQIKIVHFHGPKPGIGLEEISTCNASALSTFHTKAYIPHIEQGICCDQGRTATWGIKVVDALVASDTDVCDVI